MKRLHKEPFEFENKSYEVHIYSAGVARIESRADHGSRGEALAKPGPPFGIDWVGDLNRMGACLVDRKYWLGVHCTPFNLQRFIVSGSFNVFSALGLPAGK